MSKSNCFHCGEVIPKKLNINSNFNDSVVFFCCYGCQAITDFINDADLSNYYKHRTENATNPIDLNTKVSSLALIEDPDLYPLYVFTCEEYHQVQLSIKGMTCAACSWLIEKHLGQFNGVNTIHINLSTSLATLSWQPDIIKLENIEQHINHIGYQVSPFRTDEVDIIQAQARKHSIIRLGIAGVGMMQVMMSAIALYAGEMQDMDEGLKNLLRWTSFIFATPVVLYSAAPFFKSAIRDLKIRYFTMDLSVSLGIGLAYLSSVYALLTKSGHVYFDSVTMFTFFLLVGRFLEEIARHKTNTNHKNQQEFTTITLINEIERKQVPLTKIKVGDIISIAPGEVIPTDGIITEGTSSVDESTLTGEYLPVLKKESELVTAYTTNVDQTIQVEVTAIGKQTRVAAIERLTERALREKPKIALLTNKVAHYFVISVLLISVITFFAWHLAGSDQAYWIVVSVLVVTCPCALSLATPVALTAATNKLKDIGLLVTRGHVIESLAKSKHIVFDKTGTLTYGQFDITHINSKNDEDCLAICAALETNSVHPIAKVFKPFISDLKADNILNYTGLGVEGKINGQVFRFGNAEFVSTLTTPEQLNTTSYKGLTLYLASKQQGLLASLQLQDKLRDKVHETITKLKDRKLKLSLLSGDSKASATAILSPTIFDHYLTGVSPEEKWQWLNAQPNKENILMVGDGLNDVPTLAGANTSIAMANSSDLAKIHADAVLLSSNIQTINEAISIAIQCRRIIKQNLFWAASYNAIMLPAAVLGLIAPWAAAIGMASSSLIVVLNANRLSR